MRAQLSLALGLAALLTILSLSAGGTYVMAAPPTPTPPALPYGTPPEVLERYQKECAEEQKKVHFRQEGEKLPWYYQCVVSRVEAWMKANPPAPTLTAQPTANLDVVLMECAQNLFSRGYTGEALITITQRCVAEKGAKTPAEAHVREIIRMNLPQSLATPQPTTNVGSTPQPTPTVVVAAAQGQPQAAPTQALSTLAVVEPPLIEGQGILSKARDGLIKLIVWGYVILVSFKILRRLFKRVGGYKKKTGMIVNIILAFLALTWATNLVVGIAWLVLIGSVAALIQREAKKAQSTI